MAGDFPAAVDYGGVAEASVGDGSGGAFDTENYGEWEQGGFKKVAAGVADSGVVRVWFAGGDRREEIRNGFNTEGAGVGAQRAQKREKQEHRQECLCYSGFAEVEEFWAEGETFGFVRGVENSNHQPDDAGPFGPVLQAE